MGNKLSTTEKACQEDENRVFCDSCRHNDEQKIATFRCKQCRDNLCVTCCRFIHERVKEFSLHSIIDLRIANTEIDNADDEGYCVFHSQKPIEVFCRDHEKFGCSYCLTTTHRDCHMVISLDEIVGDEFETLLERFTSEIKLMKDSTTTVLQNTNTNMLELNQKKTEIHKNVRKSIKDIKQQLDDLYFQLGRSLKHSIKEKVSEMNFLVKLLEDFDATLAQTEKNASTIMTTGNKKQMFVAVEQIKQQISNRLENLKTNNRFFQKIQIKWNFNNEIETLEKLTTLCDFEYTIERYDFVAPIQTHYNIIQREIDPKEIVSFARNVRVIKSNRIFKRISTDNHYILVATFDFCNSPWKYYCGTTVESKVFVKRDEECFRAVSLGNPSSLLLNSDKSVRAFGHKAEEQYHRILQKGPTDYYFFKQISRLYESEKTITSKTRVKDINGKEMRALEVITIAYRYLLEDFWKVINKMSIPFYKSDGNVKYVIIMPSHSDQNVQDFIFHSAVKSGFPPSHLTTILETEAVFIHFQNLAAEGKIKEDICVGKKYLVASLGDEMSVLAIHKKSDDGLSDEILRISTGPWGLQSVLCEFETCMSDIFGVEHIQMLKLLEHRREFDELIESFLIAYFFIYNNYDSDKIRLRIPVTLLELENTMATKVQAVCLSKYSKQVQLSQDTLRWNKNEFVKIGEKTIKNIIKQIKTVLAGEMTDVDTIILCGKLSNSVVVQTALVEYFDTKRVVVLDETYQNSAAINGAMQACVER